MPNRRILNVSRTIAFRKRFSKTIRAINSSRCRRRLLSIFTPIWIFSSFSVTHYVYPSTANTLRIYAFSPSMYNIPFPNSANDRHFFQKKKKIVDVIDSYAMDKYSPCNVFFASQTTLYTSNGIDGTQTKMVPFLFYPKGRNAIDDVDKVIDHRYKYKRNGEDYDAEGVDAIGYYSVFPQPTFLSKKI